MENHAFAEKCKLITGIVPKLDMFDAGEVSDVVLARNFGKVVFLLTVLSAGTNTGTGTIVINASAANDGASPTAVPFRYTRVVAGSETQGDLTAATAAGFTTTAGESATYIIEVDPRDLPDAKPYVHLAATEVVNDPVTGACTILLLDPRYAPTYPNVLS